MHRRFRASVAGLAVIMALASAGFDDVEDADVRPSLMSATLAVDASGRLTARSRTARTPPRRPKAIRRPRAPAARRRRERVGADLTFPPGFDPSFSPGEVQAATFDVADDGVWSAFCGESVQLVLKHQTVTTSGNIIDSLGDHLDVHLACAAK